MSMSIDIAFAFAINISIAPEYSSQPSKTQYITQASYNGGTRYVMGTIDNQTFQASIRLNYTLNPKAVDYYDRSSSIARLV